MSAVTLLMHSGRSRLGLLTVLDVIVRLFMLVNVSRERDEGCEVRVPFYPEGGLIIGHSTVMSVY